MLGFLPILPVSTDGVDNRVSIVSSPLEPVVTVHPGIIAEHASASLQQPGQASEVHSQEVLSSGQAKAGATCAVTSTHITIILESLPKPADDTLGDSKFFGYFQLGCDDNDHQENIMPPYSPEYPSSLTSPWNTFAKLNLILGCIIMLVRNLCITEGLCNVPSRHGGALNSRRTVSLLLRLVEGEEGWKAPDHPQGVLLQNWDENELNRSVTCVVLKTTDNDRLHLAIFHDEFRGP
ncbi:uncharacterized protein TNCV_351941 [Trichonephila clavipes]|nr:uncharacterized protein TNCV_351941 [Trichonephila clavipes]